MGVARPDRRARTAAKLRSDGILMVLDLIVASAAYAGAFALALGGGIAADHWQSFAVFVGPALAVTVVSNWLWGLYGRVWQHASVVEARRMLAAGATFCSRHSTR